MLKRMQISIEMDFVEISRFFLFFNNVSLSIFVLNCFIFIKTNQGFIVSISTAFSFQFLFKVVSFPKKKIKFELCFRFKLKQFQFLPQGRIELFQKSHLESQLT